MFADALEIIIIMLGVAILTALICWLIWRNRYRILHAQYMEKVNEYDALHALHLQLGKDHEALKLQFSDVSARANRLTADLEACNKARVGLDVQLFKCKDAGDVLEARLRMETTKLAKAEELFDTANAQALRLGAFKAKFDQIEPALKEMAEENKRLKAELAGLHSGAAAQPAMMRVAAPAEPAVSPAEEDLILSRIRANTSRINFDRIGAAAEAEKDDLKIIKGIGPFIEKKLNALNIFTFRQIANFTEEDEDMVNEAIEFFPGRIHRDKWVPQAQGLMTGGAKAIEEATTLKRVAERASEINFDRIGVASEQNKDDLKIVSGIGPFIEKKLNSIGIYTFRQIANFTSEDEDKVNEVIEFFPGRIRRDEWSRQATSLADQKEGKS